MKATVVSSEQARREAGELGSGARGRNRLLTRRNLGDSPVDRHSIINSRHTAWMREQGLG